LRAMAVKSVVITRQVLDSVLSYSRMFHPREGILLLRGKSKGGVVMVDGVVIPPAAIHGSGFSSFGWGMLPIDLTYVGVAHSHPSGHAHPSHQDILHVSGKIMVIAGAPYTDDSCVKVYDVRGEPLHYEVKEGPPRAASSFDSDEE
jgi:proteasome lid subunit RPN8/RPN11